MDQQESLNYIEEDEEKGKKEALDSNSSDNITLSGDLDGLLLDSPDDEEDSADYNNEEFEDRYLLSLSEKREKE